MTPESTEFVINIIKELGSMGLLGYVLFMLGKFSREFMPRFNELIKSVEGLNRNIETALKEQSATLKKIEADIEDIKDEIKDAA